MKSGSKIQRCSRCWYFSITYLFPGAVAQNLRQDTIIVPSLYVGPFPEETDALGKLIELFHVCSMFHSEPLFVSDSQNFSSLQSSAFDNGYHAFGELTKFVNCLSQKTKANHSWHRECEIVGGINDTQHLKISCSKGEKCRAGTRVLAALDKVGS